VRIAIADAFPDLPDGSVNQIRGGTRMTAVIIVLIGDTDFVSGVLECLKRRFHVRLGSGSGHSREKQHCTHCSTNADQTPHDILPQLRPRFSG
jgi:hypothetical protein